jgi:hypothetical protein
MYFVARETNESIKLNISKNNIAWETDKKFKFANPENFGNYAFLNINLDSS